ncbi:hypothetical protein V1477_016505 [Vespula maculifrons]|uniref:Uncharacterized protein n=1 Tax=Vespula maculifrons TaxID=7453 RepID=A0ABD2B9F6_VESMC
MTQLRHDYRMKICPNFVEKSRRTLTKIYFLLLVNAQIYRKQKNPIFGNKGDTALLIVAAKPPRCVRIA